MILGPNYGCVGGGKYGDEWCPLSSGRNVKQVYVKGTGKYKYCVNNELPRGCHAGVWYFYDDTLKVMQGPYTDCANPDGDQTKWCPEYGSTVSKIVFVEGVGKKQKC